MSTPSDIQALLASIRPRPSASDHQPPENSQSSFDPFFAQRQGYRQPSVSSPIFSPQPANGTPPHHGSDIISPNVQTPVNDHPQQQNVDRTASLLNLLRFNQPPLASSSAPAVQDGNKPIAPPAAPHQGGHARGISASDLVASFMAKPGGSQTASPVSGEHANHAGRAEDNAQDMLLKLLNRPKSGQPRSQSPEGASPVAPSIEQNVVDEVVATFEHKNTSTAEVQQRSSMRMFGSGESRESTPFELEPPKQQTPVTQTPFTYVNPFQQLAAASRNHTPQPKSRSESPVVEILKADPAATAGSNEQPKTTISGSSTAAPSAGKFSFGSGENGILPPTAQSSGLSEKERKETVSEALGGIAGTVEKQVEDALARAGEDDATHVKKEQDDATARETLAGISHQRQETAAGVEQESNLERSQESSKEARVESASEAVKDANDAAAAAAADGLADSWESAEDSADKGERIVRVFNFPLKPFVSMTLQRVEVDAVDLRDDGIMDVARLKKDFDQLDRSLTSATSEYIAYALTKSGGMRIIRQDDGSDKQIFRAARDRIFHVSLCTTESNAPATKEQAVLGIGVSGSVYWATISKVGDDLFERDALETESVIFPPFPASDENTSGGQLKTRARRSSRHPEFFAIGRGKNIHVIWPQSAMDPKYGVTGSQRKVDTEKFFKERTVKITTGKAGKDFIFSEDDTVIVSLDKTGRMRFWDLRVMDTTDRPIPVPSSVPEEIRVPLMTLVTGSPSEKSWPTSVLFIDKLRPYVKASALRYVLVGLKQNHTLQLWDIGLGKAVQELNFPHDNESDAICSVAYHPGSGIIVVGHPTRNVIYFIHLSAPRYSLPPMNQATYIERLAKHDARLPKPESTACMSGIRAISFASKGQLRSLELLPLTKSSGSRRTTEDLGLFELYVMHSRGVTCLNIKKEDLGWSQENKITHPVNALEEGYIEMKDLQSFPVAVEERDHSTNSDHVTGTPSRVSSKEAAKNAVTDQTLDSVVTESSRIQSPKKKAVETVNEPEQTNGVEKVERKKKKTSRGPFPSTSTVNSERQVAASAPNTTALAKDTEETRKILQAQSTDDGNAPAPVTAVAGTATESINLGVSGDFLNKEVKKIEKAVSAEFNKTLGHELQSLYRRIDQDRRTQDASAAAKQDAILRLVSSTLSDNVEKNLARIISEQIQSSVVPEITNATSLTLNKQLNDTLSHRLNQSLSRDGILVDAVTKAVQNPNTMKVMSDAVVKKLGPLIKSEMSQILPGLLTPTIGKMSRDVEQLAAQVKQMEAQRQRDSQHIEQLSSLVRGLCETVSTMASSLTGFQDEFLNINRRLVSQQSGSANAAQSSPPPSANIQKSPTPRTPEEIELAEIAQSMANGRYEEGAIKWLSSSQQANLFDRLFVNFDPSMLSGLSPIVALSVAAAVTSSLQTNVAQRLTWLETVFKFVNLRDPDIREVVPRILEVLTQRLESAYMAIAENGTDPVLPKIAMLARRVRSLRTSL